MQKKQLSNYPVWFDGISINEAAFCEEFLHTHKILFTNNHFLLQRGGLLMICPFIGENIRSLRNRPVMKSIVGPLLRDVFTRDVFFQTALHSVMVICRHCTAGIV